MQRRLRKAPKGMGCAKTGNKSFHVKGVCTIKASGNYALMGWSYHPTKGFRRNKQ